MSGKNGGGRPPMCPDDEFQSLFNSIGPSATARKLKVSPRAVYARRQALENRGMEFKTPPAVHDLISQKHEYPNFHKLELYNGVAVVASDLHVWPDYESAGLRGLKKIVEEIRPQVIVLNGDVLDFARISRHPARNWQDMNAPDAVREIECAQDHLSDLVKRAPRGVKKIWTRGNHDDRLETYLIHGAKDIKGLHGTRLSDHFPLWEMSYEIQINDDVVCKHRWHGGVHAPYNNTMKAGKTMVTGHNHSQQVRPWTDLNGTRYGVDTGMVQAAWHPAFNYAESNPRNWISGFGVLSFYEARLLYPELASVWDENQLQFRGKVYNV
jgi:hypothetical protein